jgi:hypothetical protein
MKRAIEDASNASRRNLISTSDRVHAKTGRLIPSKHI